MNVSTAINMFIKPVLREKLSFEVKAYSFGKMIYEIKKADEQIKNTSKRYTK